MTSHSLLRSSWALFLALALVMVGNGLQGSLIGIRTQLESFSDLATGLIVTAYYAGFLVGSWYIPRVLRQVGHIRVFVGLASLVSATVLVYAIFLHPIVWIGLRIGTGLAMAGLYVTVESWLNDRATNENRGRIMALYLVVLTVALIGGQVLLTTADAAGFVLFVEASVLVSLAVIPLALSPIPAPDFDLPERLSMKELYGLAPLGVIAGFLTGASNGALFGMTSVWGAAAGLGASRIALLVSAGLLGSLILVWPLGALSDRYPRRRVIGGASLAAVITASWATLQEPTSTLMIIALLLYGGVTYPLYSLAASHINDAVPRDKVVSAASGFVFITGLGAIVGPLTVTAFTSAIGRDGFLWALAALLLPVATYSLWRIWRYVAPEQLPYLPIPMRSTPVWMGAVVRRRPDGEEESTAS